MTLRFLILIAVLFTIRTPGIASELGVNFYGLSYHFDRADSSGKEFHAINPGAGIQFVIAERGRNVWFLDGGIYRNSSASAAKYAAAGYRIRVAYGLHVGVAFALFQSPDNNAGSAFVAPFPVISYRYKRVALHLVPLPRYGERNRNAAIGIYGTIFCYKNR